MASQMLPHALHYHNEGLCVIPVTPRDKKPALVTWEEYHNRMSTLDEINKWFGNGHQYNIGLVHMNGFVTIDIDHDSGLMTQLVHDHDYLFEGRIEQSGSGEGYHIPLKLDTLPDFGLDQKQGRPRGNRTWKTKLGDLNIRARFCQTVAPPSIHPTGNLYRVIQTGDILRLANLDSLIHWLNKLAPPAIKELPNPQKPTALRVPVGDQPAHGNDLLAAVKEVWPTVLSVFANFGMAANIKQEHNGEFRLLGNGGLLLTEDFSQFYCFSDQFGGGTFEAWGFCRFGSSYDKHKHFRQVLLEMAEVAGIDPTQFCKPANEEKATTPQNTRYWAEQYSGYWSLAR